LAAELREAMERLQVVESPSLPILSLYLNLAPERIERRSIGARLRDLLDPIEKRATSGELDHDASMSLRSGIGRILDHEPDLAGLLGHGVAIFLCEGIELDERLIMPRRVWDCAIAGPRPYLRPLQAVLDEYRKLAAVVLDGRDAEITVFHMGSVESVELIEGELLRKSDLAGWHGLEERRHRQHAEEARNHLFREVAARLLRLCRDVGVDLVLVGGEKDLTGALLPFLDKRVREVTETFVVDVNTLTPSALATRVARLEQDFELREEEAEVEAAYATAAEGGLAVVGMGHVLRAVNRHALSRLLIHDGARAEGAICSHCGALSQPALTCIECGHGTVPVPELLESLARSVVDAGGSVEHVMAQTRLVDDQVAATLRFAIG
jgi:peptide chain release factor subunit 1